MLMQVDYLYLEMLKISFLLSISLALKFIGYDACNEKNNGVVIWKEGKKLAWEDFKGSKPDTIYNVAGSSVQLKVHYTLETTIKNFKITCLFFCNKSWVTLDSSDYLLQHEQGHFDMGEIFARKLRKQFTEIKTAGTHLTQKKLDSLIFSISDGLAAEQAVYDNETNHSLNRDQQLIWHDRIQKKLDSLAVFKK